MSAATPFSFGALTPLPPRDWSEFYPDAGQRISTRTSRSDIVYDDNRPKSAITGRGMRSANLRKSVSQRRNADDPNPFLPWKSGALHPEHDLFLFDRSQRAQRNSQMRVSDFKPLGRPVSGESNDRFRS
jgi:hypothetical protein